MKCIIAGSRDIDDYPQLLACILRTGWADKITEVVCGESENEVKRFKMHLRKANVDIMGAFWAEDHEIAVKHFPANWKKFGKSAGPIRNQEMAEYGDHLLLLWWGNPELSPGSFDMLTRAKAEGLVRKTFNYVRV